MVDLGQRPLCLHSEHTGHIVNERIIEDHLPCHFLGFDCLLEMPALGAANYRPKGCLRQMTPSSAHVYAVVNSKDKHSFLGLD